MRLIKLSTDEFADEDVLQTYFADELRKRTPKGLFIFGKQIAPNGIKPGETILFSYRNKLRFVAKAKTGRKKNIYRSIDTYPNCFEIKMPVRKANIALEEVERKLQAKADLKTSFEGQG